MEFPTNDSGRSQYLPSCQTLPRRQWDCARYRRICEGAVSRVFASEGNWIAQRGFTLVELLVAISIWSVLSLAVLRVFHAGVRAAARLEATAPAEQEARALLDQIAQDFRNAIDGQDLEWASQPERLTFAVACLRPDPDQRLQQMRGIQRITYWQSLEGSATQPTWHRSEEPLGFQSPREPLETLHTTTLTNLQWEFATRSPEGAIAWSVEWRRPQLPIGLRVQVHPMGKDPSPPWTKTIFRPVDVAFGAQHG